MEITKDLISYLETLGRIQLTEDEKERVRIDLGAILNYIDKLNELDTNGVEPLSHAIPMTNVFREDVVTNESMRDRILANAPDSKDGSFKVLKTVE